jgi:hypothetical protein
MTGNRADAGTNSAACDLASSQSDSRKQRSKRANRESNNQSDGTALTRGFFHLFDDGHFASGIAG